MVVESTSNKDRSFSPQNFPPLLSKYYNHRMLAIPAIDLLNGQCVRLRQGAYSSVKVYSERPDEIAAKYAAAGARRLHIVDLDAARGSGDNQGAIGRIRRTFPGIIGLGGGIRSLEIAMRVLETGVDLLVVGTVLIRAPSLISKWIEALGPVFIAGLDADGGIVKISGWQESSGIRTTELAPRIGSLGLKEIIYTDISRDGTLRGPNIQESIAIVEKSGLPLIISGGIGELPHLQAIVDTAPPGISGVILGKALYEGKFLLEDAIRLMGNQQ